MMKGAKHIGLFFGAPIRLRHDGSCSIIGRFGTVYLINAHSTRLNGINT